MLRDYLNANEYFQRWNLIKRNFFYYRILSAVVITPRHPDAVHPSKNEISYFPVYNRPSPNVIFNDCYTEWTTKLDDYTFKGKPNKNIETELEFLAF